MSQPTPRLLGPRARPAVPVILRAWMFALALWLGGCASPPGLTLDPVGPMSGSPLPEKPSSGEGLLQVYSQRRQVDDAGVPYEHFTPYVIYTHDDRKVQAVPNRIGSMDQKPMTVPLPEGRYFVYAHAEGFGRVRVPIAIRARQLTQVYLTYEGLRDRPSLPDTEWVRLPGGPIVGRRAHSTGVPSE